MKLIRPDFIFSYWIFVWFILYILGVISFSPKFPFIIGLLENIVLLFAMLTYGTNKTTIMYFVITSVILKMIPIYYLYNDQIKIKDILFTVFIFILFSLWLKINNQTVIGNLNMIRNSILEGKNNTPLIAILQNLGKLIKV